MDPYEATKKVFSRIQILDPENASKIMGLLLIQDHGEKEMIRLAFGPESLLQSVVLKARQELGISPNIPSTPSTPSSPSPFHNPLSNSSRIHLPKGLNIPSSLCISSLASPLSSASSPSWGHSNFHDFNNTDESSISPNSPTADLIDEFHLQEQLSFLNDPHQDHNNTSPSPSPSPGWGPHRRSCSVSDVTLGDDLAGALGWKPCLYFARGFCKNGTTCRFLHVGGGGLGDSDSGSGSASLVGSSTTKIEMMEQCHELLRSKSMQHHKMMAATQLMAARANSFSYSGSKPFSFLQQQQNEYQRAAAAAAALMMGEDMHQFSRSRLSRSDFLTNGGGLVDSNHISRQIYLTFPADSTFREEDVSNYFSIYGPVQDVRIPYQQKRMFGFVTFVYPETVRIILAKGNPHFVCDSRVLVKPYKEKGKIPDKYRKQQQQLQQMERGDFSACNSPTALDPRDPFDNQLGSRMMYNSTEELLWRRKLEEVEEQTGLQQALELQSRRLMNLQLNLKQSHHHRALSAGAAPFPSPNNQSSHNQALTVADCARPDGAQENGTQLSQQAGNDNDREKEVSGKEDYNCKESPLSNEDCTLPESLEHNLPDSPFASGTAEQVTTFPNASASSSLLAATSALDLTTTSFKSCYFQMPRLPTGPGAIGM